MTAPAIFIPTAMIIIFLGAKVFIRRHPPEMSDEGIKRLQKALVFAIISSGALGFLYVLSAVLPSPQLGPRPPLVWLALGGNLCNATAMLYFFRELFPGGEIIPEGMTLGLLTGVVQVIWLLSLALVLVEGGF